MCIHCSPEGHLVLDKSQDDAPVIGRPILEKRSLDSASQKMLNTSEQLFAATPSSRCIHNEENFKLLEEIGRGGYGSVRRGIHFGEIVAVKSLHEEECKQEDIESLSEKFMTEAGVVEKKKSKHIVQLYCVDPDKRHIVMEYCKNGSLYDVIRRDDLKPIVLDWKRRLQWMTHVALGMNVVHNQPPTVLHRDLKSSNIFVDEHWIAKVGDFGLSKPLRVGRGCTGSSSVEDLNMIWQAPEVRKDKKFSTKSDVYSFGVIMHEMLLLKGPYGFDASQAYVDMRINYYIEQGGGLEVPEDRSVLPGRWHPCLERYISLMYWCCAPDPDERPEFGKIVELLQSINVEYCNAFTQTENTDATSILNCETKIGCEEDQVSGFLSDDFWEQVLQPFPSHDAAFKRSPFENGPPQTNEASDDQDCGESFCIPEPELWIQMKESFLEELERNTSYSGQDMTDFCNKHPDELDLSAWLCFGQILAKDGLMDSKTWKTYKPYVLISTHSGVRKCNSVAEDFSGNETGPSTPSLSRAHSSCHDLYSAEYSG